MKPILFNTEMVRTLLDNRKTVTRRVVKPQPFSDERKTMANTQPYCPGDILYVRETWRIQRAHRYDADAHIEFKAGGDGTVLRFPHGCTDSTNRKDYDHFTEKWGVGGKWRPSIHMPRKAARIYLRVTDISVCRVQDITDEGARKEGCRDREDFRRVWNECYAKPRPVKDENGIIGHYESYPWEDIQETRTYRGKPWYVIGNPWVWVIEFEKISREGTLANERMD